MILSKIAFQFSCEVIVIHLQRFRPFNRTHSILLARRLLSSLRLHAAQTSLSVRREWTFLQRPKPFVPPGVFHRFARDVLQPKLARDPFARDEARLDPCDTRSPLLHGSEIGGALDKPFRVVDVAVPAHQTIGWNQGASFVHMTGQRMPWDRITFINEGKRRSIKFW